MLFFNFIPYQELRSLALWNIQFPNYAYIDKYEQGVDSHTRDIAHTLCHEVHNGIEHSRNSHIEQESTHLIVDWVFLLTDEI